MKTVQKEINVRIGTSSDLRKGQLFIILTSVAWGSSFVFIKWGVEFLNPFVYLFFRFLVAAVITLPFLRFIGSDGFKALFLDKRVILIGLLNTVAFFCEFVGMKYTTAGVSALLTNINVVFVASLAYFYLGEGMGRRKNIALAGSVLGIFLVAVNGNVANLQGGTFFGNSLILISGILWAFYIILLKIVLDDKARRYANVNSMELTYAVTILTLLFSLPPALFYGFSDFSLISDIATVPAFIGILYMGVVCTILAYFLYFEGLKRVSASVSALYLLLQIMFAVVLAFLLLGEVPTLYTVLGGLLIGASIYLVS
ncbi:MAG: DMT family transporter [Candidatus Jordarchaeum sp.]|uniref:DMT family transporter n=1 Tax=Candidatus Jordarchaeum sp. TaxID=2823881 RepID=UPI00404AED77